MARHHRALPSTAHRRATHHLRPRRPARPHPRQRGRGVHPLQPRRARHAAAGTPGEGRLMSGNSKGTRRRFGAVRQLASGRWQARYPGPDGVMRPADTPFLTKRDAEQWLTLKEGEILRGDWINPDGGRIILDEYAPKWIEENPRIKSPRTREL